MRLYVDKYNLMSKVVAITTDGGANVVKAVRLLRQTRMPCIAHLLNLVLTKGLGLWQSRPGHNNYRTLSYLRMLQNYYHVL